MKSGPPAAGKPTAMPEGKKLSEVKTGFGAYMSEKIALRHKCDASAGDLAKTETLAVVPAVKPAGGGSSDALEVAAKSAGKSGTEEDEDFQGLKVSTMPDFNAISLKGPGRLPWI